MKTQERLTVQDMKSIAEFNRIIMNYLKMLEIKNE